MLHHERLFFLFLASLNALSTSNVTDTPIATEPPYYTQMNIYSFRCDLVMYSPFHYVHIQWTCKHDAWQVKIINGQHHLYHTLSAQTLTQRGMDNNVHVHLHVPIVCKCTCTVHISRTCVHCNSSSMCWLEAKLIVSHYHRGTLLIVRQLAHWHLEFYCILYMY